MPINQLDKITWIANTIAKAGKITFKELNRKWMANDVISGGVEMSKRSFHKWVDAIFNTYGLIIECEKGGEYRYYILNKEELNSGSLESWLLNTTSINNSLQEAKSLKDKIILEEIPSGHEYLEPIIDALKNNHLITITYYNYWRDDEMEHQLMPLCLKLWHQRWYVVGKSTRSGHTSIYSLDRILDLRIDEETFETPKDFSPEEYFDGCFGIIADRDKPIETVRLKVDAMEAKYIRSLPLMPGEVQQETEQNDEYSIFELRVRPTRDFIREIFAHLDGVEVLAPQSLRDDVKEIVRKLNEKYTEK